MILRFPGAAAAAGDDGAGHSDSATVAVGADGAVAAVDVAGAADAVVDAVAGGAGAAC